jgi:hypothetical protein
MSFFPWFRRPARQQHKPNPYHAHTLHLETLEDRALPSAALPLTAGTTAAVGVIATQDPTITAVNGFEQSASVNYSFGTPLQARVTENGQGVPGVSVTFSVPASAAGGFFGLFARSATVVTDANGLATAPVFTANGTLGTYTVTASANGVAGLASFNLSNVPDIGFPNSPPALVNWQLWLALQALPSFNTPQGESDLANQFGTWFAFAFLQSPPQATQLFWQEVGLTQQFLLDRGNSFLIARDPQAWGLSHAIVANPLYNAPVGYGMGLLENELILVSVL